MPVLPAIQTDGGTMNYAPLSDQSYSPSPVLSRVMPSTAGVGAMSRISSTSSSVSSDSYTPNGYTATERHVYQHSAGSEETLSATNKGKGRAIVDEGDVGDYREKERERERKGKMKADGQGNGRKAWDEEQGRVEEIYGAGVYPPTNEEEAEERKIQENLARMAARDMARRRASRLSRQIPPSPSNTPDPNEGGFSSSTSFGRRPQSLLSLGSSTSGGSKRGSILGLMDGIWPKSAGSTKGLERIDDAGELPLTQSHSRVSSNNPEPSPNLQSYTNPYDAQPRSMHPPLSPSAAKSPFADPESPQSQARTHARQASTTSEQGFSYSGPGWRGGAAVAGGGAVAAGGAGMMMQNGYQGEHKEKWWHALCAWGSDLDGGHGEDGDGQAGRTNPME